MRVGGRDLSPVSSTSGGCCVVGVGVQSGVSLFILCAAVASSRHHLASFWMAWSSSRLLGHSEPAAVKRRPVRARQRSSRGHRQIACAGSSFSLHRSHLSSARLPTRNSCEPKPPWPLSNCVICLLSGGLTLIQVARLGMKPCVNINNNKKLPETKPELIPQTFKDWPCEAVRLIYGHRKGQTRGKL